MNPSGSVEDFKKNYILREIPQARFGLLYENDKGEYVVLNDVRMADIRLVACLLAFFALAGIACLLHICVKASRFHEALFGPRPNNKIFKNISL